MVNADPEKNQQRLDSAETDSPSAEDESSGHGGAGTLAAGDEEGDFDAEDDEVTLADELGIEDLTDILFADRGRIFSAAGRESPIAEFEDDGLLLRPPQKPFQDEGPQEEIVFHADEHGILLNELGERRKIVGAKFRGQPIYVIAETKPGTIKHYAVWFDDQMQPHKFFVQGDALTSDMLFRIRNRTHDGEISIFPEITTD